MILYGAHFSEQSNRPISLTDLWICEMFYCQHQCRFLHGHRALKWLLSELREVRCNRQFLCMHCVDVAMR